MPPLDARSLRRGGRARAGSSVRPIEALERREVLSYSALGYSLPDLSVRGYAGSVAAWGQPLTVDVTVNNLGASSINQPLNLEPNSPSTADAPASTLAVFASNRIGGFNQVLLGTIDIPAIPQNSLTTAQATFTLPSKPPGLPGAGGHIYLTYAEDPTRSIVQTDYTTDRYVSPQPIAITAPLPDIELVGLDIPTPLQPGSTVQPGLRIANLGPADVATQGPLTVEIVASQNKQFGPGDLVLATYTIDSLPGVASAPSTSTVGTVQNLQPSNNIITLDSQVITLPSTLGHYYLGVKINPQSTIIELGKHPTPKFDAILPVYFIPGVPPSSDQLGSNPPSSLPVFPYPLGASNIGIIVGSASNSTAEVGQIQAAVVKSLENPSTPVFAAAHTPLARAVATTLKTRLAASATGQPLYPKYGYPGGLVSSADSHSTSGD